MNIISFYNYLKEKIMILDGATGTELQKKGMPNGVCPEAWVLEHPDIIQDVQREYVKAGSNAVYTCTFGGNGIKLSEFGLSDSVFTINKKLAELSREAVGRNAFVVGDIAPTGQFIKPFGDISFEACVNIYKEQVKGLLAGGVDFFVIETMMDIQEARAALIAVRESCDLPVCVSMTFDESQKTLTGTDPVTALITLQSLGANAFGCNCSTGPSDMLKIISKIKPYAKVPLLAKPNAGLPKLVDGKTVFDMEPQEFGSYMPQFVHAGVNILGGCCGTSPLYIEEIKLNLSPNDLNLENRIFSRIDLFNDECSIKPIFCEGMLKGLVTSPRKTVFIGHGQPVVIVGERINPTGKAQLKSELKEGKLSEVRRFALEQVGKGAEILDVNVGMPGIDERETMLKVIENLSTLTEVPLCIDSSCPEVIEAALRVYPGRALINSISGETEKMEKLIPIAAKYGAMFVLLPLNDKGVPESAQERFEVIKTVYGHAEKYGFNKSDIVVDGLLMTVSADQKAAAETLRVIDWCTNHFGVGTIVGLSNVSFGLPERGWVNTAFLAMAIGRGLTMAIANPASDMLVNIKMASDVLMQNDLHSANYIGHFTASKDKGDTVTKSTAAELTPMKKVYDMVVRGDKENIGDCIKNMVKDNINPKEIVDSCLIPAITYVGVLFDKKEYFLPQLIQSAETVKKAFGSLEAYLKTDNQKENDETIGIVLATVKGDIHDIGKNIVGLMLKNYGFKVYDLGKDVSAEDIIRKAKETGAKIIGLSALMTTTMVEMKSTIELSKKEGLKCKFMIGGAVVDQDYAMKIGADGYSKDAYDAVKLAKQLSE